MKKLFSAMVTIGILSMVSVASAKGITINMIAIGDSREARTHDELFANPPKNTIIVNTGLESYYGGARLENWANGNGSCDESSLGPQQFYDCIGTVDNGTKIDVIYISFLAINDIFNWWNKSKSLYGDMKNYLIAWRHFYVTLHEDFPDAVIIHATGYPMKIDPEGCFAPCGFYIYGGSIEEIPEIDCASFQDCFSNSNGMVRGLNRRLIEDNEDLEYLYFIDTFEKMLKRMKYNENKIDAWVVDNVSDCIHLDAASYFDYYKTWIKRDMNRILKKVKKAKKRRLK